MQQSQNVNNKKTLIININKTSKYEMGSNKIVKTKLSHKSQKEQNKGKIIFHMVQCKVITKAQQIKRTKSISSSFQRRSK